MTTLLQGSHVLMLVSITVGPYIPLLDAVTVELELVIVYVFRLERT